MVWDIWSLDCDGHCFGKHRLLSSHRIERMDSSLTYLRALMCQRCAHESALPYDTSSFTVTVPCVHRYCRKEMQISFKLLVALDNTIKILWIIQLIKYVIRLFTSTSEFLILCSQYSDLPT